MANWLSKASWNTYILWHLRGQREFPFRPLAEIIRIQNRRVRSIVTHAYKTVPYYREVMDQARLTPNDFRTADDLARLPLLTAEQLVLAPQRFLSRRYTDGGTVDVESSGTAGRPKHIRYNQAALFLARTHRYRHRVVLAHFLGPMGRTRQVSVLLAGRAIKTLNDFYRSHTWIPRSLKGQRLSLSPEAPLEENIASINRFQPDVIHGYGSWLGALFRYAWERKLPLFRPRLVNYFADRMAAADRLLIEDKFGAPVLSIYGATESLNIGFQCERREGFHVSIDDVAFRVVDEKGKTLELGGTGSIVISNLINRATVLLNYRLGDTVTLSKTPCLCGRTLPTLDRIEGRADDLITLPSGEVLHSLVVMRRLHAITGVVQVQTHQTDPCCYTLRAVCSPSASWTEVCRQLEANLRALCGDNITVMIEQVDTIPAEPGGKVRWVVSNCRS